MQTKYAYIRKMIFRYKNENERILYIWGFTQVVIEVLPLQGLLIYIEIISGF